MNEWKDIIGYEGFYQINRDGKIKSIDRIVKHPNGYTRLLKGKPMKPFINGSGYLQVGLSKNGKKHFPFVHKLVAESFIDNQNNLKEVNHIDHNKLNCNVSNLEWCTRSENMQKMVEFYGIKNKTNYCRDCDKEISNGATLCRDCLVIDNRKVSRPSKEELITLLKKYPLTAIGKLFGVSDNAIRKWCRYYGLPFRKKELSFFLKSVDF